MVIGRRGVVLAGLLAIVGACAVGEVGASTYYVYAVGGDAMGTSSSDVYYAQVQSGGVIAGWNSTAPLPSTMVGAVAATIGDWIFVIGGWEGTGDAVYAGQHQLGGGIAGWISLPQVPVPMISGQSGGADPAGFLYIGGDNWGTAPGTTVYAASWNGSSLGSWNSVATISPAITLNAVLFGAGHLWSLGGYGAVGDETYSAPAVAGSVGGWTSLTPLPSFGDIGMAAFSGTTLAFVGGASSFTSAYAATVSGGSVGSWSSSPAPAGGVFEHGLVAADGYFFVIGGASASSSYVPDVWSAQDLGGAVGGWSLQAPLPIGVCEVTAMAVEEGAPTATPSPASTSTPTAVFGTPAPTSTPVPTCAIAPGLQAQTGLFVDRNVFVPSGGPLQITWSTVYASDVMLHIYNSAGELIRRLRPDVCLAEGIYRATWDGRNGEGRLVSANVYVLRVAILGDRDAIVRRVALVR